MANYRRIFLDGYSYYLTIVTHRRNPILIDNIELLRESFRVSKSSYKYTIDAIVVLPDHFHMIITPEIANEYPKIIKTIKQHFTKNCDPKYYVGIDQSPSRTKEGYLPVWQKKYYEHTIRNEKDFQEKSLYMFHNPVKHQWAEKCSGWKYSSFNRSVGPTLRENIVK